MGRAHEPQRTATGRAPTPEPLGTVKKPYSFIQPEKENSAASGNTKRDFVRQSWTDKTPQNREKPLQHKGYKGFSMVDANGLEPLTPCTSKERAALRSLRQAVFRAFPVRQGWIKTEENRPSCRSFVVRFFPPAPPDGKIPKVPPTSSGGLHRYDPVHCPWTRSADFHKY